MALGRWYHSVLDSNLHTVTNPAGPCQELWRQDSIHRLCFWSNGRGLVLLQRSRLCAERRIRPSGLVDEIQLSKHRHQVQAQEWRKLANLDHLRWLPAHIYLITWRSLLRIWLPQRGDQWQSKGLYHLRWYVVHFRDVCHVHSSSIWQWIYPPLIQGQLRYRIRSSQLWIRCFQHRLHRRWQFPAG